MFKFFYLNSNKSSLTFKEKLYKLFHSFLLIYVFVIISTVINQFIVRKINLLFNTDKTLEDLIKNSVNIHDIPFYLVIFLGPIIEEIIYRLNLSFNRNHLIISILFLEFYFFNKTFIQFTLDYKSSFLFIIVSTITVLYLIYFYKSLYVFLNKHRLLIYWISIFLFGASHVFNIENLELQYFYLYFFFVTPQLIIGYFTTNLRLKLGFFWGLFLHMMINSINVLINL